MLIEQRVSNEAKSTGAAYLLWLFLGGLGGHRFYLGRIGSGLVMLLLAVVGWATIVIGVGAIPLIILGIWVLVDAFLIPGMIQKHKDRVRTQLTQQAMTVIGAPRREPQM
ncbi:MAG: TM2 domain-containing protein [Opitutus sp.]|nr:TM2 domain-containing protein [Opitutus sp.]